MIFSYRRVSTDQQDLGAVAQADSIKRWVDSQNQTDRLLAGWKDFFDDGISGSVPISERPNGQAMCNALKSGDIVVCSRLDRLFRSVSDAATTMDDWAKKGITLVSIAENFDMTTPMGRAMCQMASVFAQLEREMIRSRTKAALAAKKARGECVGEVPYGHRRWLDNDGDRLIKEESEQSVIAQINTWKQDGNSASRIAMFLNALDIPAKKGGKWSATQVRRILERNK
jgi:DNA invertase Pin-like site-specific DNA recombinase